MKKLTPYHLALLTTLLVLFSVSSLFSQDTLSTGTFILHKFQQPIGKETYSIVQTKDSVKLRSDFKFNDRGQDVPLQTTLTSNRAGQPLYFKIQGKTSRVSVIDAGVHIAGDSASIYEGTHRRKIKTSKTFFLISGYSPVAVQMQLINYWKTHGRPQTLTVYPKGNIRIRLDGHDTLANGGKQNVVERYQVKGLIWGSELVWTDAAGKLIALFTNDAEGDKFEAIDQAYIQHLPALIGKTAAYGMASLKAGQQQKDEPLLALTNGTIIDVVSGGTTPKATVLIENGRIIKAGASKNIKVPRKAKIIDLAGKTILPGLWDMHAHFQQVEWGPAYLAAGVTTVRDCGNEFDFINAVKNAIDHGQGVGPNIIKAGIIDGDGPMALGIVRVNTAAEAQTIVQKYKDAGYQQIKIYSSVKPEMIKAIATEAHAAGLPVTGHVPQGVALLQAIELGQDQVNHFPFVTRAMLISREQKLVATDTLPQKVLRILKEKNIVVDPTLGIYEWILRPLDQPLDAFEPGVNYMTEDLKEIFRNFGMPAEEATKNKILLENGKATVLALHRAGIPIVAGTDMIVPGFSLYRELELYHQAGLSSLEALQTATINPARVMKMETQTATITEGKTADLIIVDGNPLQNISDIRKTTLVIKNGKVYNPSELRKLIDFKP
jgi:imidazolonepropionase-like amidohydrolase